MTCFRAVEQKASVTNSSPTDVYVFDFYSFFFFFLQTDFYKLKAVQSDRLVITQSRTGIMKYN